MWVGGDTMYFWLIVILILIAIEIATVNLVTVWFVASAIVALVLSYFVDNFVVQFAVFVVVGVLLLLTTRNILKKWLRVKNVPTNLDRVIGELGIVTEAITKHNYGEVKVDGKKWTAFAENDIEVGKNVKILAIEGVKLKVEEEK